MPQDEELVGGAEEDTMTLCVAVRFGMARL